MMETEKLMRKVDCPKCRVPLNVARMCDQCGGTLTAFTLLNHVCPIGYLQRCIDVVKKEGKPSDRICPTCVDAMTALIIPGSDPGLELDFCLKCQLLWSDPNELSRLPQKSELEKAQVEAERLINDARKNQAELEAKISNLQQQAALNGAVIGLLLID